MTRTSSKPENRGTKLGFGLFRWRLWSEMSPLACKLWIGLYASDHARRFPIGLWEGDERQMARSARLSRDQVDAGLAELVDVGAVAYEHVDDTIVLCMLELPDRVEGVFSASVLQSWWTRYSTVPPCATSARYVALAWWLCATDNGRVPPKVAASWRDTFGTLAAAAGLCPAEGAGETVGDGPGGGSGGRVPPEGMEEGEGEGFRSSSPERPSDVPRDHAPRAREPVNDASALWAAAVGLLAEQVLPQHVDMWLTPMSALALEGSLLQLRAPNPYVRSWFESNYLTDALTVVRELAGAEMRIAVDVEPRPAVEVDDLVARARERYGPARAAAGGVR